MNKQKLNIYLNLLKVVSILIFVSLFLNGNPTFSANAEELKYENKETKQIVKLVDDAAKRVRQKGKEAFEEFREPGSRWRQGEMYVFVMDTEGNMQVNIDKSLEGKNQMQLKDVNGKPIIKGIIDTVTTFPDKTEGWYHYEWYIPGAFLPQWKSSYIKLAKAPSGKNYVIGCGTYDESVEKAFVVDNVNEAVRYIEKKGSDTFTQLNDPTGRFIFKDTYIFVFDMNGTVLANPAFPNLEGRNLLDMKDTQGKQLIREMIDVVESDNSGWVDYMWPKPGDSVSTRKSAYVSKTKIGDNWVLVGSGVYLADASKAAADEKKITATQLMTLVREGAGVFEKQGEDAYSEFRKKGSKWFHDDTYFFVWDMDGTRLFHAANPEGEGKNMSDLKDNVGRPIGKMILNTGKSESGEGWVHYMYPEPGKLFPSWKSTYIKKVTFPSEEKRIIGSGIYNMQMDETFIEDVVNRAAALISEQGREAFSELRDKTGPFFFMDTYVFVNSPDGTELVNPAQPSLEGKNLMDVKDLKGKTLVRDYIAAAMKEGSAWVEYYWYKPGENTPARKKTFVRKIESGEDVFIVGSGFYPEE